MVRIAAAGGLAVVLLCATVPPLHAAEAAPVEERGQALQRSQIGAGMAHRQLQQARHDAKLAEQDVLNARESHAAAQREAAARKRDLDAAEKAQAAARARLLAAEKAYEDALRAVDAVVKPAAK